METNKKRKNPFSAISINRITAERFRLFSKKVTRSHSDTLDSMIDFFEGANISPRNKLMMYHLKLYSHVISRLDYIVELIREQEQKYYKPTHDMLKSLFDGTAITKKQQPLIEKNILIDRQLEESLEREPSISLHKYNLLKESQQRERREFLNVINKIERVQPHFGKAYFKIDIDASGLDIMKRRLKL